MRDAKSSMRGQQASTDRDVDAARKETKQATQAQNLKVESNTTQEVSGFGTMRWRNEHN